ncbi:MAG: DNA gyrase subunit A [Flavobacteriales bacterium]|nr:DNA gyrase subunit A [Flavobacteriales bacterium]
MAEGERIIDINIENEMKTAYIDYSMSVIVSRALPDVRDGFKPVHRRVLYGMLELGVLSNRPHKKSARIVGEVMGKYHPHGDSSVYDTMVRMAQDWSLRYPLVDGQGNFGSMDADPPAAMRYTEARLRKIAEELLEDLDKETVDFQPNFDDSLEEPKVMPGKVPNLLINGVSGIAVGMATNMAPHNLFEVCEGIIAYIENPEITTEGLMQFIKAPDFPTGGVIHGIEGIKSAYETGRGRVVMRARTHFEEVGGRECIIVTEVPYQVNKAEMQTRQDIMIKEGKLDGISNITDLSSREGIRIIYEIRKDAIPNVVLNNLYKHTSLQTSFSINNIALVDGRPVVLNLKDIIRHYVNHRHEVVTRRTQFELKKARERAHILEGLLIALDNIEEVIKLIRASQTPDEAREGLMSNFTLSEIQARAILDMRLQRLTGLERDKIREEHAELMLLIAKLLEILGSETLLMGIIKDELKMLRDKYGDERRSTIEFSSADLSIEDMIPDDNVVITITHAGYIKRTNLTEFRSQNRGGVGSKGTVARQEDFVEYIFTASNHDWLLIFTRKGRCFWMRVFEVPEGAKASKGRAIQNLIQIEQDDKVLAYIPTGDLMKVEYAKSNYVILCTKKGLIKKTLLEAYSRPRSNGINAVTIVDGDELLAARLTNGSNEVIMATREGKAIRFNEETVRAVGRNAQGVKGVRLGSAKDELIGMVCIDKPDNDILVVSEQGYGKRSSVEDYRITNRGGKGVKTINITEKTGSLISILAVDTEHDFMIINKSGITIRLKVEDLRVMGRNTQGVRLINLRTGDEIAAVCSVLHEDDEEPIVDGIVSPDLPQDNAPDDASNDNTDSSDPENSGESDKE